jgi:2Fe-2S ferredoxin
MRGVKQTIEGNDGESVMEIAVKNGLAGILADWAGSMSCAT